MQEVQSIGKLSVKTKIAYGMGDLGANIVVQAVALY